ncbi:MAG: class I SAM-dependent methyltransferase, partial [Kiritimatiellia bacterium]
MKTNTIKVQELQLEIDSIANFDEVLDAYAQTHPNDTDKIPYFADIWPSAIALANYLATHRHILADRNVIELGCGLGLPAIVAAKCGAALVTATDFHPACIAYCNANAIKNGVPEIRCRTLDWRNPDIAETFNCIIGSDLLYEAPQVDALLHCIEQISTPDTRLILADPLRKHMQAAAD